MRTLRSAGFDPLAPPLREGTIYVARATDYRGILMRVVLDARTGAIRDANRIVPGPGNYAGALWRHLRRARLRRTLWSWALRGRSPMVPSPMMLSRMLRAEVLDPMMGPALSGCLTDYRRTPMRAAGAASRASVGWRKRDAAAAAAAA